MANFNKKWEGPSKSEQFMVNKYGTPQVTKYMTNEVSDYRKQVLANEVQSGLFKDGSSGGEQKNVLSVLGVVDGFGKTAQLANGAASFRGPGDASFQAPEVYSPLWLNSNLSLPRDRATINAWLRSFFTLNPFVHNSISLHSTYPISRLNIKCANKKIENFFNEMIEETDLMNICVQIAQEYWLLGEAFVYAELDRTTGKWGRLLIQNPDYVVVKRTVVANEPVIMLRPDQNLQRIVSSNKPADVEQRRQLPGYIVDAVKRGNNIPLDNFNVSHLARRVSPYEIRGTGLPVAVFKQLMLMDKLRESKFAQADNMVNPTTLVKIGSDTFKPTYADIEAYKDMFEQAQHNKDFKIFTHDAVAIERVGYGQGIYDISGDITQLIKEIHAGLFTPSVLIDGGADTSYANGGVALDVLRQRYMQFRNMMSHWLKRKIFAPISQIQGFYEMSGGKKKLIVPDIDWNHMSLFDAGDYINILTQLTQGAEGERRVSLHTLYRSMGLEYEDEIRKMKKEAIQAAIFVKEKASLQSMDLSQLRALDEEDEIPEIEGAEGAVPGGEEGAGGPPGLGGPPPGLPGLDMGPPPGGAPPGAPPA